MTAVTLYVVSTAVYASVKGGFFQGMFGNETKQSSPYIEREIENGKGMGLSKEEAEEPYYMKYVEIKYKDGTKQCLTVW